MTGLRSPSPLVRVAAWATPLCVLPSAVWRVLFVARLPDGCLEGAGAHAYVVALSLVTVVSAFLTVGLVSRWGDRVPGWVPRYGGRPVHFRAVTGAAGLGLAVLAVVYGYAALNPVVHWREPHAPVAGCPVPGAGADGWVAYASYAPLLAWLPLLAVVTVSYWRRHRAAAAPAGG